jgi:hypothetical protein
VRFKVTDRIDGKTEIIFQTNDFIEAINFIKLKKRDDLALVKAIMKRLRVCGEQRIKDKTIILRFDKKFNSSKTKILRLEYYKKNFKQMFLVKLFKNKGVVTYEFFDTINTFPKFRRMFENKYPDLCRVINKVNDKKSYYLDHYKKNHHLKHGTWYILLRGDQTDFDGKEVKGLVRYTNLKKIFAV